jgi:hypothetical protein
MPTSRPLLTHAFGGHTPHPVVHAPSLGGGMLSSIVWERLREVGALLPQPVNKPLEANKQLRLFNANASLKIAVSEISMHLPSDWRRLLFEKIDDLHEPEYWDDADKLADLSSFRTFLRTVLQQGPMNRMSLGISDDGQILAGWQLEDDSLSLAFLNDDRIRWSVVRHIDGDIDSAAGTTTLARLPEVLKPYNPEVWFGYADDISAA